MTSEPDLLRHAIKSISVLPSTDIDRTLTFFTRLGFKLGGKHPGFISVCAGDRAVVNLYLREASAESFPLGRGEVIILLETGEASKLFEYVERAQLELVFAPHDGGRCEPKPWGFCQFSVLDPDGNKITFASHLTDDESDTQVQAPSVPDL